MHPYDARHQERALAQPLEGKVRKIFVRDCHGVIFPQRRYNWAK
jgi:hypothetical protein